MKGILINRNHEWYVGNDGKQIKLHPEDQTKPLKLGEVVDFEIVPIERRELREFTGSFSITIDNVAKLK
jgi:hypothetical protein